MGADWVLVTLGTLQVPCGCCACVLCMPFSFTPMRVNSISFGSPHVRPMGRTCGEPDEIKENTHPKTITALFVRWGCGCCGAAHSHRLLHRLLPCGCMRSRLATGRVGVCGDSHHCHRRHHVRTHTHTHTHTHCFVQWGLRIYNPLTACSRHPTPAAVALLHAHAQVQRRTAHAVRVE